MLRALVFFLAAACAASATPSLAKARVVVTFQGPAPATSDGIPTVKRYGRRAILSLQPHQAYDAGTHDAAIRRHWKNQAVSHIEADARMRSTPLAVQQHAETVAAAARAGAGSVALIHGAAGRTASSFLSSSSAHITQQQQPTNDLAGAATAAAEEGSAQAVYIAFGEDEEEGYASDVADGIVWAAGGAIDSALPNPTPARFISVGPVGEGPCPSYMQSAVDQAIRAGARVVASSQGAAAEGFPANCRGVLTDANAIAVEDGDAAAQVQAYLNTARAQCGAPPLQGRASATFVRTLLPGGPLPGGEQQQAALVRFEVAFDDGGVYDVRATLDAGPGQRPNRGPSCDGIQDH